MQLAEAIERVPLWMLAESDINRVLEEATRVAEEELALERSLKEKAAPKREMFAYAI